MRKPRSDSVLDSLPPAQREQLVGWLLEENPNLDEIVERVRKQFGVRTSRTALGNFYARRCYTLRNDQAKDFAELVVSEAQKSGGSFDAATLALVKQRAFERVYARDGNINELAMLAGILGDAAKVDLKRQEMALRESQQALRLRQYEDKISAARASLERAKSKGGLSKETRELIEQQLALL